MKRLWRCFNCRGEFFIDNLLEKPKCPYCLSDFVDISAYVMDKKLNCNKLERSE